MTKPTNEVKDRVFTVSGLKKEFDRVRWPKRKEAIKQSGKVLLFTVLFALFFTVIDLATSALMVR